MLTMERVQKLLDGLDFNRENVVQKTQLDEKATEEAKKEVARILAAIAEAEGEFKEYIESKDYKPNELYTELYYKLGLVALFKNRNQKDSEFYFQNYLELIAKNQPNTYEHAEALSLLGHAKTIDGTFKDEQEHYLQSAINLLDELEKKANNEKIQTEKAFVTRYLGLLVHRKSMGSKKAEDYAQAQALFEKAANAYEQLAPVDEADSSKRKPCINQAESLHLWGASLSIEGKYKEALDKLNEAQAMEVAYVKLTGKPHFMLYTTMQNLANTKREYALASKASDTSKADLLLRQATSHIQAAEDGQRVLFPKLNADFAKTLQFAGDVYLARGMYILAAKKYVEALELKLSLFKDPTHGLVKWSYNSLNDLIEALIKDISFNMSDARTFLHKELVVEKITASFVRLEKAKEKLSDANREGLEKLRASLNEYNSHALRSKVSTSPSAFHARSMQPGEQVEKPEPEKAARMALN